MYNIIYSTYDYFLVALIQFTSSTFSELESSRILSVGVMISGGIVSSKNITIQITFVSENATG